MRCIQFDEFLSIWGWRLIRSSLLMTGLLPISQMKEYVDSLLMGAWKTRLQWELAILVCPSGDHDIWVMGLVNVTWSWNTFTVLAELFSTKGVGSTSEKYCWYMLIALFWSTQFSILWNFFLLRLNRKWIEDRRRSSFHYYINLTKAHECVGIVLFFLYFSSVSLGLFFISKINILGPTSFDMVHQTIRVFGPCCVKFMSCELRGALLKSVYWIPVIWCNDCMKIAINSVFFFIIYKRVYRVFRNKLDKTL